MCETDNHYFKWNKPKKDKNMFSLTCKNFQSRSEVRRGIVSVSNGGGEQDRVGLDSDLPHEEEWQGQGSHG